MAPRAGSRSDVDAALGALAERFRLSGDAVGQLRRLQRLLVEDPLAPTAVRNPRRVIDDHLADSLVALELDVVCEARAIADLGSGAGVPGLPLAIALASAEVALVESTARKCAFLERAVLACGLANACVVQARAESWHEGLGACDLVTARALAPLEVVVEYAAPLLTLGGTLVVWRGWRNLPTERAGAAAAAQIGLEPVGIVPVRPYPAAEGRHLHLMSKVRDTPPGFPRRPGMALKRPLGSR